MTDKKISELTALAGADMQATDEIIVARPGTANYSMTRQEFLNSSDALLQSSLTNVDAVQALADRSFATRAAAVTEWAAMVSASETPPVGTVWTDDQGQYLYLGDSTAEITGMTGWTVVLDYAKTNLRFPSRTSFEAANLPTSVDTWSVLHPAAPSTDARWYEFQRADDVTLTIDPSTDLDTGTDTITSTAHGLYERAKVIYSAGGGTEMTGLTDGNTYYLVDVSTNTFKVSSTRDGSAIDITGAGAGSAHTFTWAGQAIESANGVKGVPLGDASPDHWGSERVQSLSGADSATDALAAFQMCLDWLNGEKNYYGAIPLADGYYRLSGTLHVYENNYFQGAGARESRIHGNFASGPVVRFYGAHSGYRDMGVTGGATRRAAPLDFASPGVLFEGHDEANPLDRNTNCSVVNFYNYGHPGSGVHVVGPAFTGLFENADINNNKGHGISFDRGEATGRTNLLSSYISGVCNILGGRISNCGGHVVACGSDTDDFSTPALRVVIDNIEGGNNAGDASARFANAAYFLRGANYQLMNSGISHPNAMAFVAGRNIHLTNNRSLDNDGGYAYIIGTYDKLSTRDIFIDGMNIITPTTDLDPAVLVTLPSGETTLPKGIFINNTITSPITTLAGTDSTMGSGGMNRVPGLTVNGRVPLIVKGSDQTVNNSISFINDDTLTYYMYPNEEILFHAVIQVTSDGAADFRARFTGPSGSTVEYSPPSSLKVDATGSSVAVQSEVSGGTTMIFGSGGIGSERYIEIRGRVVNGSNAGNLTFQWAQGTADVSDTIVKAGSYLSIERIEL